MDKLNLEKTLMSLGTEILSDIYDKSKLKIIVNTISNKIDEIEIIKLLKLKYGSQILSNIKLRTYLLNRMNPKHVSYIVGGSFEKRSFTQEEILKCAKSKWDRRIKVNQRWIETFDLSDEYLPPIKDKQEPIEVIQPKYNLFDYQNRVKSNVNRLFSENQNRFIINMPTGAGKTRTAMECLVDFWRSNKKNNSFIIWFAKSDELCNQALETLEKIWENKGDSDLKVYKLWGEHFPKSIEEGGFVITSFGKIYSLMKSPSNLKFEIITKIKRNSSLVVVDEAHQTIAPTYKDAIDYLVNSKKCIIIGLTATPGRGWDVEQNKILSDYYDNKIIEITDEKNNRINEPVRYLQDQGYLSKVETDPLKINNEIRLGENEINKLKQGFDFSETTIQKIENNEIRNLLILNKIKKYYLQGKSIIVFAASLDNCALLCDMANILNIKSCSIDKQTSMINRRKFIQMFRDGESKVLFNYGVLTTGFDAPNTDVVVIARPTSSPVLYNQMIGRGIRGPNVGGNKVCVLVDVIDNIIGMPNESYTFSMYRSFYS